jgi:3-isopropylmalate/(R)-2-methylmalate dehydratase small subunit
MTIEPVRVHRGTALPLRRREVDTDQIIPAEFCKRLGRTGYADTLFHRWRQEPGFVLNEPAYAGASILLAGPDFGVGSSREHAVWALFDYGFRAVIAPGFGDIFRSNAGKNRLVTAVVPETSVTRLQEMVERSPATSISVDLVRRVVVAGDVTVAFALDDYVRTQFIEGIDDIGDTQRRSGTIADYERRRPPWLPALTPS